MYLFKIRSKLFCFGFFAKAQKNFKKDGLANVAGEMFFYCSKATHIWIEKAAILFGYGTKAIR